MTRKTFALLTILCFAALAALPWQTDADTKIGRITLPNLSYGDTIIQAGTYDVEIKRVPEEKVKVGDETLTSRNAVHLLLLKDGETLLQSLMVQIPPGKLIKMGGPVIGQILRREAGDQTQLYRIVVQDNGNQYASFVEVR